MQSPNKINEMFTHLTIDRVLDAVEKAGFSPSGHCFALNSLENRVYDISLEDDSHIIAKFYRPGRWNLSQIQEEHDFLWELEEAEIPVCAPIRFSDKTSIKDWEGIHYAFWPRTGGRIAEELGESELPILGRLLARIHNIGGSKAAKYRMHLDAKTFGRNSLKYLESHSILPEKIAARYAEASLEICKLYEEVSKNVPMIRIHGDCHKGNLLLGDDGWFFLDFDDFVTGPTVQDFWMLLPFDDQYGKYQRELFLSGYREFRDFQDNWFGLVEPLRALRYIHYSTWIAKRWEDPSFQNAFPHFGTEEYWEKETQDLEQSILTIQNGEFLPDSFKSERNVDTEEELTNKDFFFDWED